MSWGAAATLATVVIGVGVYKWRHRPRKLDRKVDPIMVSSEGLVPGSALFERGQVPNCQVGVAYKEGSTLHICGAGIRVEDHLILPTHITFHGKDLYIYHKDREYQVTSEALFLAADVSAYHVPEKVWTDLGIKMARLGPLSKTGSTVTVTSSVNGKYSIGGLRCGDLIGRTEYRSSTEPGFSGSAYANGAVILGQHYHGGSYSGGYEMLYLYARLKLALDQPVEDTGEQYFRTRRKAHRQQEDVGHETKVIVRFNDGTYHTPDKDLVRRMEELAEAEDWADQMEYEDVQEEYEKRHGQRYKHAQYSEEEEDEYEYQPHSASCPAPVLTAGFSGESQGPAAKVKSRPVQNQQSPKVGQLSAAKERRKRTNQYSKTPRAESISARQLLSVMTNEQIVRLLARDKPARKRSQRSSTKASTPTAPQTPQAGPSGVASASS